ncbi:MAG: cell wall-binding protein, partial [Lachnospiraceae bacterium]|nr:cell wall-binding protein [Lachnospiraceae bacterium]
MRKQTKLVALLSATAVMALGASIMSYAAANWVNEDGVWVYYDKDGEAVTEEWKRSGSEWYWLNEDGEMATDCLVEYDEDYYYVDETGAMVTNKWISIENEDYDGDDEDEPMNHWYYFGSSGKAYKSSSTSSTASFKTIGTEKYIFDDEGKMLYGWIDEDGNRVTGDDDWKEGMYYCGDENDGAQSNAQWEHIEIIDNDYDSEMKPYFSSNNVYDDEEQTRW